jgi:hypothetical protein
MMNNETVKTMVASLAVTPADDSVQDHAVPVSDRRGFGPRTIQAVPEETLVIDERYRLSPSQMVESKLKWILGDRWLPDSHLHLRGVWRNS